MVKRKYIELLLLKDFKPEEIAVKFTEAGLDQIKSIRKLFLQCKNCKELYNYPVIENDNDADKDFCSHNCRYKFEMEQSVRQILKNGLSIQEWEEGEYPIIFDEELKQNGFKCILEGDHDEIHHIAFQNVVRETYEKYPKVYAKVYNIYDEDNYDQSLWIKEN